MNSLNNDPHKSTTETEIRKHKDKLNNLINRLINTNNIDKEISINNEIKNETEFLSSLLNIKRKELNQINNMFNNNFNPMNQSKNMNPLQQQQQMMMAQKEEKQKNLNNSGYKRMTVIFERMEERGKDIYVQCMPYEKVSSIIEQYRNKSGDLDPEDKFMFNAKALHQNLTVAEAGLVNNAKIFVVSGRRLRGGKDNLITKCIK